MNLFKNSNNCLNGKEGMRDRLLESEIFFIKGEENRDFRPPWETSSGQEKQSSLSLGQFIDPQLTG